MHTHTGNCVPSEARHHSASRSSFAIFLFGLALAVVPPLWAQTPPRQTFAEIEKKATEAREAKRIEDAVALYREALKLKPGWKEGNWYLGTSLYGLKRYPEARNAFHHLAISQPSNGQAWALAGMCEFELTNYVHALEYLSRSESAGLQENAELAYLVRFRIALLLNRTGEFGLALSRLIPITAQGTYPEVIEALGLSVLRVPLLPSEVPEHDRDLYLKAGEAMNAYVTHDTASAARQFEELVTAYPNRPNVHYARGSFLMENEPDKALPEFQRELELNPSHAGALAQVAKLYLKKGAPEKALPYARHAVELTPNAPGPRRVLGESLLESGNAQAAIEELGTAVRFEPEVPQTHFLLAEAYKQAGKTVMASKELAEFQRLDQKQKSAFTSANPPN